MVVSTAKNLLLCLVSFKQLIVRLIISARLISRSRYKVKDRADSTGRPEWWTIMLLFTGDHWGPTQPESAPASAATWWRWVIPCHWVASTFKDKGRPAQGSPCCGTGARLQPAPFFWSKFRPQSSTLLPSLTVTILRNHWALRQQSVKTTN